MRIVHICMTQYSDGWSYQENMLAKYHKRLGHEVFVLTSMYCYKEGKLTEDTKTEFTDINGVKVIRLQKKSGGLLGKTPTYLSFFEALCELTPDVIFSHGCQYLDTKNVIRYVREHPDVRLFVDNHADFSNSATNFLSRRILHGIIWKRCAQRLIPYTEKFWGVMPSRVDFLHDVYGIPKDKTGLLVMGADDDFVEKSRDPERRKALRESFGVHSSDFLVVTGGKIDSAKKQTLLLMEAVSKIRRKELKLLVFGSIEDEIKEEAMQWIDGERIIYAGWISSEQSYDYFGMADLVVFPGRHSVFWEQVAGQGIPMIVKDWPGTHHIDVGGNVSFLAEDSVSTLNKELYEIFQQNEKYQDMKSMANRVGQQMFLYSRIAKKSISLSAPECV